MTRPGPVVLLVDDEPAALRGLETVLISQGFTEVITESDARRVLPTVGQRRVDVIVLDLGMPHTSGQELLRELAQAHPQISVIIATANDDVETAVQCMRMGAVDYLVKPVDAQRMASAVGRTLELRELRRENERLRERLVSRGLRRPEAFADIITSSPTMMALFEYIETVGGAPTPVLITGETGTGKELVARAVHRVSNRNGEFVAVNVAGIDDAVFSDTLFGHVRGAFTGADRPRDGLVRRAAGGTLFLDEIGDLPLESQVKLLRLVQEHEFYPVGSDTPEYTDTRIVLATLRDLRRLTDEGKFRRDLFYRLRRHHIHVPPLRERLEDLPLLTEHFLERAADELGTKPPTAPPQLLDALSSYDYPGNIRELESMIDELLRGHRGGVLSLEPLRRVLDVANRPEVAEHFRSEYLQSLPQLPALKDVRRLFVEEALRRAHGNQTLAARLLGVTRQAINKHVREQQAAR